MSETIRSYSQQGRTTYGAPIVRGRGCRRVVVLGGLAVAALWFGWTTRDNWPMERLVPNDQTYHFRAQQLLHTREMAASSPLWDLGFLPASYRASRDWLRSDFGLPPWVLNNLATGVCYVSGKDLDRFSDILVVTRMSRIGCLLERYYGIADDVEEEFAGGLHLRRLGASGAYYAVRGRTLVFSPSREALIRALTLRDGEAVTELDKTIALVNGDVQGRVDYGNSGPNSGLFSKADFGLRFGADAITFSIRGEVTPEWKKALDPVIQRGGGATVSLPRSGAAVIAGDFGTPLPELWSAVDDMAQGRLGQFWATLPWAVPGDSAGEEASALLSQIKTQAGSAFALRCIGFDTNGAVPLPELELYLRTRGASMKPILDAIPALPAGQAPVDFVPYRDLEGGIVRWPVGWGGIVEPSFAPGAEGLRITMHPLHMKHALAIELAGDKGPEGAQLAARIRPVEVLELLREGGLPYAQAGLLAGHTAESFAAALDAAMGGAKGLSEIRASAGYANGAIQVDVEIAMAPLEPQQSENTAAQ